MRLSWIVIWLLLMLFASNDSKAEENKEYVKVQVEVQKGYEYRPNSPVTSFILLEDGMYYPTCFTSSDGVDVTKEVKEDGTVVYRLSSNVKKHVPLETEDGK